METLSPVKSSKLKIIKEAACAYSHKIKTNETTHKSIIIIITDFKF